MATWSSLVQEFKQLPDQEKTEWLSTQMTGSLQRISQVRAGSNVLLYGTAFLQKPRAPTSGIQITREDLNGLMSCLHGMNWNKQLTLILHTPGGEINAAETIVEYLRSKFDFIETIIPAFAMSAGTSIALASNQIIMGRQSQMGPIDPQMPYSGRYISAQAVVDQFEKANREILKDHNSAHVWAPILASLGPSLITESQNALDYGEKMVAEWLESYMFSDISDGNDRASMAKKAARYFNDGQRHKSHGRRIDRSEARKAKIRVEDLENKAYPDLQDAVLTTYHLMTILFEQSSTTKIILAPHVLGWIKHWLPQHKNRQTRSSNQDRTGPSD